MRVVAALAALLVAGCGSINNEDLRFLAVLPDERLAVDPPAEEGQALMASLEQGLGGADLRPLNAARLTAGSLNGFLRGFVETVTSMTATQRPTERAAGKRVWGPFQTRGGGWAKLTMTRAPDATCPGSPLASEQRYKLEISLASKRDSAFDTVFSGVLQGEDFDTSCGHIRYDLDANRAHGAPGTEEDPRWLDLAWSRAPGHEEVALDIEPRETRKGVLVKGAHYTFTREADGSGTFRFARRENVDEVRLGAAELVQTALRWSGDGSVARADFRISEGDHAALPITGTACFLRGRLVFWSDTGGMRTPVGSDAACAGLPAAELP